MRGGEGEMTAAGEGGGGDCCMRGGGDDCRLPCRQMKGRRGGGGDDCCRRGEGPCILGCHLSVWLPVPSASSGVILGPLRACGV